MKSSHKICTFNAPPLTSNSSREVLLAVCPVDIVPNGVFSLKVVPLLSGSSDSALRSVAPRCPEDICDWKLEACLEQHHPAAAAEGSLAPPPTLHCRLALETVLRCPAVDFMSFSKNDHGCFVIAVLRNQDSRAGGGTNYGADGYFLGRSGCHILAFRINSHDAPNTQPVSASPPLKSYARKNGKIAVDVSVLPPQKAPQLTYTFTLCCDDTVQYWPDRLIGKVKAKKTPTTPTSTQGNSSGIGVNGIAYPELISGTHLTYHVSSREPIITLCVAVPGATIEALRNSVAGKHVGYSIGTRKGMALYATVIMSIAVQFYQKVNPMVDLGVNGSFMLGTVSSIPSAVLLGTSQKRLSGGAASASICSSISVASVTAGPQKPSSGATPANTLKARVRLAVTLLPQSVTTCVTSAVMPPAWGRAHIMLGGCTDGSYFITTIEPTVRGENEGDTEASAKFKLCPADLSSAVKVSKGEFVTCCSLSGNVASSSTSHLREHTVVLGTASGRIFVVQYSLSMPEGPGDTTADEQPLPRITITHTAKHCLPLHVSTRIALVAFMPFSPTPASHATAPTAPASHQSLNAAVIAVVTSRGNVVLYRFTRLKDAAMKDDGKPPCKLAPPTRNKPLKSEGDADAGEKAPVTIFLIGVAGQKVRDIANVCPQQDALVFQCAAHVGPDEGDAPYALKTALTARIRPTLSPTPTFISSVIFETSGFAKGSLIFPLFKQHSKQPASGVTATLADGTQVTDDNDTYRTIRFDPTTAVGTPLLPQSKLLAKICEEETTERVSAISFVSRPLGTLPNDSDEEEALEDVAEVPTIQTSRKGVTWHDVPDKQLLFSDTTNSINDGSVGPAVSGATPETVLDATDPFFMHIKTLGSGTFGVVTLAQSRSRVGDFFAIKRVIRSDVGSDQRTTSVAKTEARPEPVANADDMDFIRVFYQEAMTAMTSIPPHVNIARYFGIYDSQKHHNIVMEVAEGGSLDSVLFPPFGPSFVRKPALEESCTVPSDDDEEADSLSHSRRKRASRSGDDPYEISDWICHDKETCSAIDSQVNELLARSSCSQVCAPGRSDACLSPTILKTPTRVPFADSVPAEDISSRQFAAGHAASARSPLTPHIPEHLLVCWLHQCLSGLQHLHHHGVMHRDVKAANMLLMSPLAAQSQRIVWTDFGVSAVEGGLMNQNKTIVGGGKTGTFFGATAYNQSKQSQVTHMAPVHTAQRTVIGTMGFTAPEMLAHWGTGGTAKYSTACDLWGLGVIFYCYITGRGWLPPGGCVGVACSPSETIDVCCGRLPKLCALKAAVLHDGFSSSDDDDPSPEAQPPLANEFATDGCDTVAGANAHAAQVSKKLPPLSRFNHAEQGRRAACFSDDLLALVDALLVVDFRKRPTARAALQNRLFMSPLQRSIRPHVYASFEHSTRQVRLFPGSIRPFDILCGSLKRSPEVAHTLFTRQLASLSAVMQKDPKGLFFSDVSRAVQRCGTELTIEVVLRIAGCDYVQRATRMRDVLSSDLDRQPAPQLPTESMDFELSHPQHMPLVCVSDVCIGSVRQCETRANLPSVIRRGWENFCFAHFWREDVSRKTRRAQPTGVAELRLLYAAPSSISTLNHLFRTVKLGEQAVPISDDGLLYGSLASSFVLWMAFIRSGCSASGSAAFEMESVVVTLFQTALIRAILNRLHAFYDASLGLPRVHGGIRADNIFMPQPPACYSPKLICNLPIRKLVVIVANTIVLGPRDPFGAHVAQIELFCDALQAVRCRHATERATESSHFKSDLDMHHLSKMCFELGFIFQNSASRSTVDEEIQRISSCGKI